MVPGKLADCGLPDVRLWYYTVRRGADTLPSVKAILHEIGEVRDMRKQNPGNIVMNCFETTRTQFESPLPRGRGTVVGLSDLILSSNRDNVAVFRGPQACGGRVQAGVQTRSG